MAKAEYRYSDPAPTGVTLEMTISEAEYLLNWIDDHSSRLASKGPVTEALRKLLRENKGNRPGVRGKII